MRALESRRRRAFAISAATAFALCALLLVPAQPAYADIAGDVNDWLCGLLRDCCNWMFKAQTGVLGSIGANGILSADFAHMLTSSSDLTMHDVARGVWQVAILPIGCGVLGLVFTLKLIEISQRMDGSQSLPGVKEVVFLLVFFAVLSGLSDIGGLTGIPLAFAAGTFMYVALCDILPEAFHRKKQDLQSFGLVILGIAIVLAITIIFPHTH